MRRAAGLVALLTLSACATWPLPWTRKPPPPAAVAAPAPAPEPPPEPMPVPEPLAKIDPLPPPGPIFPREDFRKEAPKPGPPRPLKSPVVQRFIVPPGITVSLVERPALPLVTLALVFAGGALTDPPNKEGRAALCAELLSAGSDKLERGALEEALADLGAELDSGAALDEHALTASALKANFGATLDLLADTLLRPGLRDGELERIARRRIAALAQEKADPAALAERLYPTVVHGAGHPYARLTTEASLGAIRAEDCRRFVAEQIRPQGARLTIVGAVSKAEVLAALGPRLKGWTGAPRPVPAIPPSKPLSGRIFYVDLPRAAEAAIQLVHLGPPRKAPDFHATAIASAILGGGFASRLNQNLRERNRYAAGARGGFEYNRRASVLRAGAAVRAAFTREAIEETCKEIRALAAGKGEGAPSADEITREKNARVAALPARFSTARATLETLRTLDAFGLAPNYYDSFAARTDAVTADAVKAAARSNLRPDRLQVLAIGDARRVLPGLKDLVAGTDLPGRLVQLDPDGKVLPNNKMSTKP